MDAPLSSVADPGSGFVPLNQGSGNTVFGQHTGLGSVFSLFVGVQLSITTVVFCCLRISMSLLPSFYSDSADVSGPALSATLFVFKVQ